MSLRPWMVAAVAWCSPAIASEGPAYAELEGSRVWTRLQSDETGRGVGMHVSLPLSDHWFFSMNGVRLDTEFDSPVLGERQHRSATAGLGLHSIGGTAHAYGVLSYERGGDRRISPTTTSWDVLEGVRLAVGTRWLIRPWVMFEGEGNVGSASIVDESARFKLAFRLLPHVWAVGGYSVSFFMGDSWQWSAGLRLAWSDSTGSPRAGPGAERVEPQEAAVSRETAVPLAPGDKLVAVRAMRLQTQPLFGAAEIGLVTPGETFELMSTLHNDFGDWWSVSCSGKRGWIRESELKPRD